MSSTNGIDLSLFDPAALMASVAGSDEGASSLGEDNNNHSNDEEEAMHERIWADLMQEGSNTPEPDQAQAPVKQEEEEALPVGLPTELQLDFDPLLVGASGASDREESPPMDLDSFLDASIAAAKDESPAETGLEPPVADLASASPSQSVSAAPASPEPQSQPAQQAAPAPVKKATSPAPPADAKPDIKHDVKSDIKPDTKADAKPDVKPKASNKRKADQAVSQPAPPPSVKSKAPKPPTPKPTPALRTSKNAVKPPASASQAKAATNVSATPVPAPTPAPASPAVAAAPQSSAPTVDPRLTKAALQAAHIMTLVQRMLDAASASHSPETPESLIQHVVKLARMDTDQLLALQVIFSQITKAHESRAAIAAAQAQAQAQANQAKAEKGGQSSPP